MYYKVSINSDLLLSLPERRKYVETMFREDAKYDKNNPRNQGFMHKFNNAIGFKSLVDSIDHFNVVTKASVESNEDYLAPYDLLMKNIRTPVDTFEILTFYIPDKRILHSNSKYDYEGKDITIKWCKFLEKVFPNLNIEYKKEYIIPKQTLREFAFEYFYLNLEKEGIYTIEFNGDQKLSQKDLAYMIPKLQGLCNEKISIAQTFCNTCKENSDGERPYHIEIVYLSSNGEDISKNCYKEYGDNLYKVS